MTGEVSWFKFHSRDWLAKTGGLAPSDKGILTDLLAIMHERGEPVPFNEKILSARCRATPKTFKKAVETLIEAGLIHLEEGMIWSGTMQDQIEFERKNSLSRKTAAEKRWKKIKQNQSSVDTDAMLLESEITDIEGKPHQGASPSTTQSTSSSTQPDHKQDTRPAAPESASDASDDYYDEMDWPTDHVEFLYDDDPAEFLDEGDPDRPIRATEEAWRTLLIWIDKKYGPDALTKALGARRTGTLTIATIKSFGRRAADVA
ncbi:hypothetical protein AKG11_03770 [Shinella sp. SUS2]|uniref:DUF1376 domain-containing protein n=1 Tax=unclassified Shinella TaxID=2643062 RepID=UPI00067FDA47|nr:MULTISPECIES: DUF1376 domain-containing protein [unclassified Shinella]KNY18259.1 hypothetical protein AKG11_03770 [Shinella sp. SUS2]KOC77454.1 hypothetical protein AKG10_01240 [Shinella sp. GWS1]